MVLCIPWKSGNIGTLRKRGLCMSSSRNVNNSNSNNNTLSSSNHHHPQCQLCRVLLLVVPPDSSHGAAAIFTLCTKFLDYHKLADAAPTLDYEPAELSVATGVASKTIGKILMDGSWLQQANGSSTLCRGKDRQPLLLRCIKLCGSMSHSMWLLLPSKPTFQPCKRRFTMPKNRDS